LIHDAAASLPPNPRHFVVTHLLNVADEWLHGDEKRPELRALAKPLEMAFVRVPFYAQNKMRRLLAALGQLVAEAVRRGEQRFLRSLVGIDQFRLTRGVGYFVANILYDHCDDLPPSATTLTLKCSTPSTPYSRSQIGIICSVARAALMSPKSITERQPNHCFSNSVTLALARASLPQTKMS